VAFGNLKPQEQKAGQKRLMPREIIITYHQFSGPGSKRKGLGQKK
jgi:hypothetical protein